MKDYHNNQKLLNKFYNYKNKVLLFINNNTLFFIFILYLLCNIFFITNNFLFWDDWVVTGNNFFETYEFYKGPGSSLNTLIFNEIIYHLPPFISRIIVFVLYFGTSVCLSKILKYFRFSKSSIFFIILIYSLNPIVTAKYALINAAYYFSYFIFFVSSYFLICKRSNKFYLISSLFLFFLSFSTQSLLCFYAIPFSILFYDEILQGKKIEILNKVFFKDLFNFIKKYYCFILIPFIFFLYAKIFLKPTGCYANQNYNKIDFILMIKQLPKNYFLSFYNIISWLLPITINLKIFYVILFLIFLLILLVDKKYFIRILLTFCIYFFSCIAYFAVDKVGVVGNSFDSRHFLLSPLPVSLFIYLIFNFFIKNSTIKKQYYFITIVFLTGCFLVRNLQIGKNVFEDTIISEAIIENYKTNDIIKNNSTFALTIDIKDYGYFLQKMPPANYTSFGLFWKAFGTEDHYAYNTDCESAGMINWYFKYKNDFEETSMKYWKIRNIPDNIITHSIKIESTDKLLNKKKFLKTYFYYVFNKKLYYEDVKNYIKINVSPI